MCGEECATVIKQLNHPAVQAWFPGIPHTVSIQVVPFLSTNFTGVLICLMISEVPACYHLSGSQDHCMVGRYSDNRSGVSYSGGCSAAAVGVLVGDRDDISNCQVECPVPRRAGG